MKTLDDIIKELPPHSQDKIRRRTEELIEQAKCINAISLTFAILTDKDITEQSRIETALHILGDALRTLQQ